MNSRQISPQIYLDHAASTPLHPNALAILQKSYQEDFANPEAIHALGQNLSEKIEKVRFSFLDFLGAHRQGRFLFTSSATESNNFFLQGVLSKLAPNQFIALAADDHPSLSWPLKDNSHQCKTLSLDPHGQIDLLALTELLELKPALIAFSHVNNQSGSRRPIDKISSLIKKLSPQTLLLVDCSQSLGKIPIPKMELIDGLTLSAHKMGGPRGIAGIYLSPRVSLKPMLYGGSQELNLRASTPVAPLIFAWGETLKNLDFNIEPIIDLGRLLKEQLSTVAQFPFGPDDTLFSPYIITLIIPNISSDILLRMLSQKNIFLSSSSACSSRIKGVNPVFTALQISPQYHKNVLRISFSQQTSKQHIMDFSVALKEILKEVESL